MLTVSAVSSLGFPAASAELEKFGFKFSSGASHVSRSIMLKELGAVLTSVPEGSSALDYRDAILQRNILGKTTESTRHKSVRHLRELYGLDEQVPIFVLLRKLYSIDSQSLPLLAIQVAWSRDGVLRSTTSAVMDAREGDSVGAIELARALESAFPNRYSEQIRNKIGRNTAASWTQSGHLVGHVKKIRGRVKPTVAAVTMALFLGNIAGYHGASVFSSPWCRLLELNSDRAKSMGFEAHRAGLLNLRGVGEVVELSFPLFAEFQGPS